MAEKFEIRNSTAEFLIFQIEGKESGVQVVYHDETVWCTQKAMAELFDVGVPAISKHLKNIFESGELSEDSVISKMETTASDGKSYNTTFYNLDAIISVGYRVNSTRATQFRQWCTFILRQFAIRGYVIDKKRMENGAFLNIDYFEHLLAEIREIRLSERGPIRSSRISMPRQSIITGMRLRPDYFSRRFRTRCTMRLTVILPPN